MEDDNANLDGNRSANVEENSQNKPVIQQTLTQPVGIITVATKSVQPSIHKFTDGILGHKDWFKKVGWSGNPFTFNILPELFVGYTDQTQRILRILEEKHKVSLIIGPTGSGKTTILKWVSANLPQDFDYIYIGKPPVKSVEFVDIFNAKYRSNIIVRFLFPGIASAKNLYDVPNFLNRKLGKKHLVVMLDEAHESPMEVLEWLRVLSDQIENMSILLTGLPVFEGQLSDIETLRKRIINKIELRSLTKEETERLIKKRIQHVGGSGEEFSNEVIDYIYERSGGFPRDIIRMGNEMIDVGVRNGKAIVTNDLLQQQQIIIPQAEQQTPSTTLDGLTNMQKEVVEMLLRPMTPGDIANALDLAKYKSRQHAVRSVNNVLKQLMDIKVVERAKTDKSFLYQLSPHIKNHLVKK